ncbi:MAG: energy coupling factor transporter S component ThiW [Bacillota bacterium]|nr:energy coupling factor transporter S component ThiW [Bacillota bacterium]
MHRTKLRKLSIAGLFCALAVVGSLLSFPVLGSRCAPVQHMVNVLCGLLLGPGYGLGTAFCASLLRNLFGLGSLLAFPGSMFGALFCGLAYKQWKKLLPCLLAELLGTSLAGGLAAWPLAVLFLGETAAELAIYAYIFPFFLSTAAGTLLSGMLVISLQRAGLLQTLQGQLQTAKAEKEAGIC